MDAKPKIRIGDRLLERGLITDDHIQVALSEQRRAYRPLGEILISLGFVREQDVAEMLAADLEIEFVKAHDLNPDPILTGSVDRDFIRATGAFPIDVSEGVLRVAMLHPDDPGQVSAVRARFPYPLQLAVTTESELESMARQYLPENDGQLAEIFEAVRGASEAFPVERVTDALLMDGIHRSATDIHIEPEEKVTRVRYRIDGILRQGENLPRDATDAIISRVKILSNLDIAERRRPQDGRLRVALDDRNVDMRVSIRPCVGGENVVLRILDRSAGSLKLEQLGIPDRIQARLARIITRSHGLFLVTGPTGSGKTTTLYSMIDAISRNVATVEDPVEYRMPLVRESQVDSSIGFGFQEGLRTLLRQDPDVILVGEIRDQETAEMAIKASMTGHLVFSTLHTNSALGAIPRLTDLGIDPYLIEDALIGVLAQRLVRKVCAMCAAPAEPTPRELEWLEGDPGEMMRGTGCARCGESGYSGRAAVTELFLPDDDMAEVMRTGTNLVQLREMAVAAGFQGLLHDGRAKVRSGMTTIDEVGRVHRSHRLSKEELEDI